MKRLMIVLLALLASCSNCDDTGGGTPLCGADEQLEGNECVPIEEEPDNNGVDEDDLDTDGVPNGTDNCPDAANPDQADGDADGVGDACDDCPLIANVAQTGACPDADWDPGFDFDGDGTPNLTDNCPDVANPDQADGDADGIGDVCDGCETLPNQFRDDTCAQNTVSPMVNEIAPNIYMLVDASGSMGNQLDPARPKPWPIDEFKEAMAMLPDMLLNTARVGIGQFPFQTPPDAAATCSFRNWVSIDENQAQQVRAAADSIEPWGDTPTGYALQQIAERELVSDPMDLQDNLRPKLVVLVTDGDPTVACDSGTPVNSRMLAQPEAVAGAQALADLGIPVYVVGFLSGANPDNLDAIAAAGGTDSPDPNRRHFVADNAQELVTTLQSIRALTTSCNFELVNTPPQTDETIVSIAGLVQTEDPVNGYTYDAAANVLTFHGQSCEEIKNSGDPAALQIEAMLVDRGTEALCTATGAEICDYVDNDCNGQIDETCPGAAEICDGTDNDLDGTVDEGCP